MTEYQGTLMYFGEKWDAPAWDDVPQIPTPVGEQCLQCQDPILEGESGITMPYVRLVEGKPEGSRGPVHTECHLRSIVGSVEHLQGRCTCHDEGAQPQESMRDQGRAVMAYLKQKRLEQAMEERNGK